METGKHLGIWMDHSTAHLMDASNDIITGSKINSEFTHQEKHESLSGGEFKMHNTKQHEQHAFYKKLGEVIKNYNQVILFGPTKAKEELANLLKEDKSFEKIIIEVKHADKMTEHQQHAFVKDYFANSVYSRKVV